MWPCAYIGYDAGTVETKHSNCPGSPVPEITLFDADGAKVMPPFLVHLVQPVANNLSRGPSVVCVF